MDSVLVTGALGKLGRWTVDRLASEYHVVGVDLERPDSDRDDVDYYAADLTEQGPAWELVSMAEPEAVVHLAAIPAIGFRAGAETFTTNVESTYNVLTAAGEADAEVVWTSSESTYGTVFADETWLPDYLPIDEAHPQRPEDPYGTSKVAGEEIADMVTRKYDIPVTSIRPSWINVPGQYETSAVREAFDPDDPDRSGNFWSYVDVRDVVSMIERAIETDRTGHEAYLAAAADNYLDHPTAAAVEAAFGGRPETCSLSGDDAAFTTTKAKQELGWTPTHSWRTAETESVPGPQL